MIVSTFFSQGVNEKTLAIGGHHILIAGVVFAFYDGRIKKRFGRTVREGWGLGVDVNGGNFALTAKKEEFLAIAPPAWLGSSTRRDLPLCPGRGKALNIDLFFS